MKFLHALIGVSFIMMSCTSAPKAPSLDKIEEMYIDGFKQIIIFAKNTPEFDYTILYLRALPE